MRTKIGRFDSATRAVSVTFTRGDQVHARPVNAVLDAAGDYDRVATKVRVADVGRDVAVKFDLGLFEQ